MFKKRSFKILVLDLDNTVVRHHNRIHSGDLAAILKVKAQGVPVIIATGRGLEDAWPVTERLQITQGKDWIAALNGAVIWGDKNASSKPQIEFLSTKHKKIVLQLAQKFGLSTLFFRDSITQKLSKKELYSTTKYSFLSRIVMWSMKMKIIKQTTSQLLSENHPSIIVFGYPWKMPRFEKAMREQTNLEVSSGMYGSTQISNNSKGSAVAKIVKQLKIAEKEVLIIGDSPNDLSLFKRFPYCIAMGNAHPIIKKHAFAQTANIKNQGVQKALEKYFL